MLAAWPSPRTRGQVFFSQNYTTSSTAQAGPAAVICVCNKNCKKGRDFYFFAQLQHDQREGTGHTDTENRGQKYISISTVIYARQVGGSGGSKN